MIRHNALINNEKAAMRTAKLVRAICPASAGGIAELIEAGMAVAFKSLVRSFRFVEAYRR